MIYNSAHDKCISIDGLSKVTARTCALTSPNRMWKWTKYGQLQSIFTHRCLTAPDPAVEWGRVELVDCDKNNGRQIWSCSEDFVRLPGTTLNLNFGNVQGGDYLVLYQGTGSWSKWKLFDKEKSICEKRKAANLERFMIYNSAHDKCISIDGLSKVTARTCALTSPNSMWKWTKYGQLQSIFTLGCPTAPDPQVDWGRVELAVCDKSNGRQIWSCSKDFLRLAGTTLNLNFGNVQGGDYLVLYQGTGSWSKWELFGKEKSICEKRKDNLSTSPRTQFTVQTTTRLGPSTRNPTEITTPTQSGKGFLIYSAAHNKCISIIGNDIITARTCDQISANQMWRWTACDQLQNSFSQTCLSAPETPVNWDRLKLSTCDCHDNHQVWACTDDFIRLHGTILNVNYGNRRGGDRVVLFQGTGSWSNWKVYGEDLRVCEKRKDVIVTTTPMLPTTPQPTTSPSTPIKISTATPTLPGFQIYSADHDKCISVSNIDVIAMSCDFDDVNQWWTWTNENQLKNQNLNKCLDVNGNIKDWARLHISVCDHLSLGQLWSCHHDLVHVIGTDLNMNYGNKAEPHIVLYSGTGQWSRWKIFGTSVNVCEAKPMIGFDHVEVF
ncbi:macrophage mannose receptor 1-like [Paramuricea clavata]|nr:macrophage mannose receptor 1-like [Paramuricea clavata]